MTGGAYNEASGMCRKKRHRWVPSNIRVFYTKDGVMKRKCKGCEAKSHRTYYRRNKLVKGQCVACKRSTSWPIRPDDDRRICTPCYAVLVQEWSDYWVQWHKEQVAKGRLAPSPRAKRKPYDRPSRAKPKAGNPELSGSACPAAVPELQGPRVLGHDNRTEAVPVRPGRERVAA